MFRVVALIVVPVILYTCRVALVVVHLSRENAHTAVTERVAA